MRQLLFFLFVSLLFLSCKKEEVIPEATYYPGAGDWETIDPGQLGWDTDALNDLDVFLEDNNSRAFLVIKSGKIVVEKYFGQATGGSPFTKDSYWYWASAGKTLTATLVGIAADNNLIDIQLPSSDYLGTGWSSMEPSQEQAVLVWHHLTMTTGLDDGVQDSDCTDPGCLVYLSDPGTRWAYHNAPYTRLDGVIEGAVASDFTSYFNNKLRDPLGMDGFWTYLGFNHVYFSTPRSMARFGLMILREGKWEDETIVSSDWVSEMSTRSQELNKSYGYLWWLNGQDSHMIPGLQFTFNGSLTPNAPDDMFSAIGRNGQIVSIIPGEDLVIVRMGDNPDNSLVPIQFVDDLWGELNKIIK